jgi:hypothetical protein
MSSPTTPLKWRNCARPRAITLGRIRVSPADSKMPAPHSHDAFEETIYGLEGVYDLKG